MSKDEEARPASMVAPVTEEPFEDEPADEAAEEDFLDEEPIGEEVVYEEVAVVNSRDLSHTESKKAAEQEDGLQFWAGGEADDLRSHWMNIQTSFVDDPHKSVMQADDLLQSTIDSLTESFRERESALRREWDGSGEPSTEDLRLTMRRYRTLLEGLLDLAG